MKLKNILITVDDIEEAKKFYHDLFGLDVLLDSDDNVILMEGLVLQERKMWGNFLQQEIIPENNACELYFEERDIEAFAQKLKELYPIEKLLTAKRKLVIPTFLYSSISLKLFILINIFDIFIRLPKAN